MTVVNMLSSLYSQTSEVSVIVLQYSRKILQLLKLLEKDILNVSKRLMMRLI